MSTTQIIIEHLIAGIQAAVWLVLMIFGIFGYDWISINSITDIPGEVLALLIIVLYPVGIFIDEIADKILFNWTERVRQQIISKSAIDPSDLDKIKVAYLFNQRIDERLKDYFSYVRTRIRIARSTALNFLLITISLEFFLISRSFVDNYTIVMVAIVGFVLINIAILSWYFFTVSFIHKTIDQLKYNSLIN